MVPMRFEREVRSALAAGMDAALELRHELVGPEHLVFGIAKAFPNELPREVDIETLRATLASVSEPRTDPGRQVRYTGEAKRVLEAATDAAAGRGRASVILGDLIDGLRTARPKGESSAKVFRAAGLEPVLATEARAPDQRVDALEYIRVSDTSDLTYYDQIARCVREAVASGVLVPGDRLSPIRLLAERLALAPGTVARAYRELEAEGIVLTAGAAGTRVAVPPASDSRSAADRRSELVGLMRPVAVAAFHLGASAEELFEALRVASDGVFSGDSNP